MTFSHIALNRVCENKAAADPAYRAELKRTGKTLLSEARGLSDEELLAKLRTLGITVNGETLRQACRDALSAQEVCATLVTPEVTKRFRGRFDQDWVWFCVVLLWERWFPDLPSFDRLDERIQAGYRLQDRDPVAACERWLEAWADLLALCDKGRFRSLNEFDDSFGGTQCAFNWVQDFEMELGNTAFKVPRFHVLRAQFCEEFLGRFPNGDDLLTENMRCALADSCFGNGDCARGAALYEQWLEADPQWGWGWIGWSDHYSPVLGKQPSDPARAEALLKQGLAVTNVRDRDAIEERLADLYEEQGRPEEATPLRRKRIRSNSSVERLGDRGLSLKTKLEFGEEGLPLDQLPGLMQQVRNQHAGITGSAGSPPAPKRKVGRNEPCPCGSGKKFKLCCGK